MSAIVATTSTFTPSRYQAAIFDWVSTSHGHGGVNAVAGSGKTSTLVRAARLVMTDAVFLAFNKHIAEELGRKLAGTRMTASTIHSVGFRAVNEALGQKRARVDDRKYARLVRSWTLLYQRGDAKENEETVNRLRSLTKLCRLALTNPRDPAAMTALATHFGVDMAPTDGQVVADLICQGDDLAKREGLIDYDDMVYLPAAWGLNPAPVGFVAVDEAQDLNAAQQSIVLKLAGHDGRILFVGDPAQSIYGFSGADAESFANMRRLTQAADLPLSICYRCPTRHLDLARAIVPHIEARENAPEGILDSVKRANLDKLVRPGDLLLCRLTAPLVSVCLELIRARVHARVRGRDIGASLGRLIRTTEGMPDYTWERFPDFLNRYVNTQIENLVRADASPARIESLADQRDAVLACYEVAGVTSAGALSAFIEGLFDDATPTVMLSTVHRAKGLENDRVFLLEPDKLPLRWRGQLPWQLEQEMNLRYVALTRSTSELYFVE